MSTIDLQTMEMASLNDTSAHMTSQCRVDEGRLHQANETSHVTFFNRLSKSVLHRRYTQRKPRGVLPLNMSTQSTAARQNGASATGPTFSSVSYLSTHSLSFVHWLQEQSASFYSRFEADRWFLVILLGVVVGLIAALLKQSITALSNLQWYYTNSFLLGESLLVGFWFCAVVNCSYLLLSAVLTTFVFPPAAGGGTVEVLAFLNGIVVHKVLTIKNLVVKFIATTFANASILPTSTQAPIIVLGSIVGAIIGQFQLRACKYRPKIFRRYRNARIRREFTTVGVASGVAAGFNSPVGGLMFALEDLSSFWTKSLTWFVFTGCIVSVIVSGMFIAAFSGFISVAAFGLLPGFKFKQIQMHFVIVLVAVVIGFIGGLLGALFVRFNVIANDYRKRLLARIPFINVRKILLIVEMLLIVMLMTLFSIFVPYGFQCVSIDNTTNPDSLLQERGDSLYYHNIQLVATRTCVTSVDNSSVIQYNPMSTLIQGSGSEYLTKLWSRDTYYLFEWYICLTAFSVYYVITIWTMSTSLAIGILVPMLVSGSLYGRAIGVGMVYAWQAVTGTPNPSGTDWQWIDPGVMAGIGAASVFGGCNRMAVASTILVAEMIGDITLIVPNFVAVFVAKSIADLLSKPLFEYQLRSKSLPYLDQEPRLYIDSKHVDLELCRAADVMDRNVSTVGRRETVGRLAQLLLSTNQSGFPVVGVSDSVEEVLQGLVTRTELYVILSSDCIYKHTSLGGVIRPRVPYEQLSVDYVDDLELIEARLFEYTQSTAQSTVIDLEPFINMSTPKVDSNYSLYRTYMMFRTLGLAQLVVVDEHNRAVGMITRSDLIPSRIKKRVRDMVKKPTAADYNANDWTNVERHRRSIGGAGNDESEPEADELSRSVVDTA